MNTERPTAPAAVLQRARELTFADLARDLGPVLDRFAREDGIELDTLREEAEAYVGFVDCVRSNLTLLPCSSPECIACQDGELERCIRRVGR